MSQRLPKIENWAVAQWVITTSQVVLIYAFANVEQMQLHWLLSFSAAAGYIFGGMIHLVIVLPCGDGATRAPDKYLRPYVMRSMRFSRFAFHLTPIGWLWWAAKTLYWE